MRLPPPRPTQAAPPDSSRAALSELEPGELMYLYDEASRALPHDAEPGAPEFDRWVGLHSEILRRLAQLWRDRARL